MTRRAALLLEALADGPLSRRLIFERTGYLMSNNAAAELRRDLRVDGGDVVCSRVGSEYVYEIVLSGLAPLIPEDCAVPSPGEGLHFTDGDLSEARVASTPPVESCATANTGLAEITVEAGGQLALVAA